MYYNMIELVSIFMFYYDHIYVIYIVLNKIHTKELSLWNLKEKSR